MGDEELVYLAQAGVKAAAEPLVHRYREQVRSTANRFFLAGADRDDVYQEGMIGLFKAICSFRADRHQAFEGFADLCIRRHIQTAVKASLRHKHRALNCCKPLKTVAETVAVGVGASRRASSLGELPLLVVDQLTPFEASVLNGYLAGLSYTEMSQELSCLPKSIDNALQRVKRKVLVLLQA